MQCSSVYEVLLSSSSPRSVTFVLQRFVSANGVRTDPSKTMQVSQWPIPTSRKEVQQFLGLANYYRRFVKDFATIAKPLHRLTERNVQFGWSKESHTAFELVRERLTTAPVLAFPDYSREFILDTDASDTGLGAVLSQIQDDGSERMISYASRVLSRAERRYCVTRRELLAVVTFVQHFRPYLLGREFLLCTDHGSLTWLSNFEQPPGGLRDCKSSISGYSIALGRSIKMQMPSLVGHALNVGETIMIRTCQKILKLYNRRSTPPSRRRRLLKSAS